MQTPSDNRREVEYDRHESSGPDNASQGKSGRSKNTGGFSAGDHEIVRQLTESELQQPHWIQIGALRALRSGMQQIQKALSDDNVGMQFFEYGDAEIQLPVMLDRRFPNGAEWFELTLNHVSQIAYKTAGELTKAMTEYAQWFSSTKSLLTLTQDAMRMVIGDEVNRFPSALRSIELLQMSIAEQEFARQDIFSPVHISGFVTATPPSDPSLQYWRESMRRLPPWKSVVTLDDLDIKVSIFATIESLIFDRNSEEGYFPMRLALTLPRQRLTDLGKWNPHALRHLWNGLQNQLETQIKTVAATPANPSASSGQNIEPRWDKARYELYLGPHLVKSYRQNASSQFHILAAFQEEGWPSSISDPLTPISKQELHQKNRLRETVRGLNKNHLTKGLLRFRTDQRGQGVTVSIIEPNHQTPDKRSP
jgi:hypothetical protein